MKKMTTTYSDMNSIERKIKFIYWTKESKLVHLTQQEFADKLNSLDSMGYHRVPYTCNREVYLERNKNYSVKKNDDFYVIYIREAKNYVRYTTDWFDSNKMGNEGSAAAKLVRDKFEELTGSTYKKAFDTVSEEFKRCVPKQFYYTNSKYLNKEMVMSAIDASSHYPANICGRLPDAHTAITKKGTVKPTKEYPFAFYIKSGHCAEYEVFDTHDWLGHPQFGINLFRRGKEEYPLLHINNNDDTTVLMKASEYELTDVYKYFYNIKQTYPHDSSEYKDAKMVLNASIGYFHKHKYTTYKYAHLVAITIGRANQIMLNKANEIGSMFIVHMCVDGIIYLGTKQYGIDDKQMGKFHQEFLGCNTKVSKQNCYIAMKDGKVVKEAHGSFNRFNDGRHITPENITSLDDQYNWVKVDPLKELKDGKTL